MREWGGMANLARPLIKWRSQLEPDVKSPEGTRKVMLDVIEMGPMKYLDGLFDMFVSEEYCREAGFDYDDPDLKADAQVKKTLFRLLVASLGNIGLTLLMYRVPPQSFLGLSAEKREVREKWMLRNKMFFESMERLDQDTLYVLHGKEKAQAVKFRQDMLFCDQQDTWESFVGLLESEWDVAKVP